MRGVRRTTKTRTIHEAVAMSGRSRGRVAHGVVGGTRKAGVKISRRVSFS